MVTPGQPRITIHFYLYNSFLVLENCQFLFTLSCLCFMFFLEPHHRTNATFRSISVRFLFSIQKVDCDNNHMWSLKLIILLTSQHRFWLQEACHRNHRGTLHQRRSPANPCLSPSTMWSARSPTIGLARRATVLAPARHTRWEVTHCILLFVVGMKWKEKGFNTDR